MMSNLWSRCLTRLVHMLGRETNPLGRSRRAQRRRLYRPQVEPLEARLAPANKIWTGAVNANWSNTGNWIGGTPGSSDIAVFDNTQTGATNNPSTIDASFLGSVAGINIVHYSGKITDSLTTLNIGTSGYTQADGTFDAGPLTTDTINVSGDWTFTGGATFTAESSTLAFNGSSVQNLTGGGTNFFNVTYSGTSTLKLQAFLTATGALTVNSGTLDLNDQVAGAVSGVTIHSGGTLTGKGDIEGNLEVQSGGFLVPGAAGVGRLLVDGNATLDSGSNFDVRLTGTDAGEFGQLSVSGTPTVAGANLSVDATGFTLTASQLFRILDNGNNADLIGTFAGLPEGASVTVTGSAVQPTITYRYPDNSIVLSTQPPVNGTSGNDSFVFRKSATAGLNEYSTDGGAHFTQVPGNVPMVFNGLGGADTLTVDFNGINGVPGVPVTLNGGGNSGDNLIVEDISATPTETAVYRVNTAATPNNGGSVMVGLLTTVTFTGLAPVQVTGMLNVNIDKTTFASANQNLTIANDTATPGGPYITVSGTTGSSGFELLRLKNDTNVSINTSTPSGDDTVTISSADGSAAKANITNMSINTGTGTDVVNVNGAVTLPGTLILNSQTMNIDASITAGAISLTSGGTAKLNAPLALNAGTGTITLLGGTFQIQSGAGGNAISNSSQVTVTSPASLDLNGQSESIDGLNGDGAVTNSAAATTSTLTVGASGGNGTFLGTLQHGNGTLAFTKGGTGAETLSGTNAHTGATTVNGGTLLVDGSTVSGSALAVNSGGTLGGSGTVGGTVTVKSGGHLAPGDSPGTINTGALDLQASSTFDVQIASAASYDKDHVTGSVTIETTAAGVALNVVASGTPTINQSDEFVIIDNDGTDAVTGSFAGLAEGARVSSDFLGSGLNAFITYKGGDGNDVAIVVEGPAIFNGTNGNDALQVRRVTGSGTDSIQFLLGGAVVDSRPFAGVDSITVNGLDGSDTLTVNYGASGGFFALPVTFHGSNPTTTPGDKLVVTGGTFAIAVHTFTTAAPAHSGNIVYDVDGNLVTTADQATVSYDGLEPVDMSGSTIAALIFHLPDRISPAGNDAFLEDNGATSGDGNAQLRSNNGLFDTTVFSNPAGSLTINGGAGDDTITVAPGFDSGSGGGQFTGALTIDGGGGADTIILNAPLASGGNVSLTGETINVNNTINTTAGTSGTVTMTAHGPITVAANITAKGTITLTTVETPGENVPVGHLPPPDDDITINSGVTIQSNADVNLTSGDNITPLGATIRAGSGHIVENAGVGDVDNDSQNLQIITLATARNFFVDSRGLFEYFYGNEKWLRGDVNSLGTPWYFLLPDGTLSEWDGSAGLNGHVLIKLNPNAWQNPELLVDASNYIAANPSQVQAADQARAFFRSSAGNYYQNAYGGQEKWIEGMISGKLAANQGNPWYFILPDGSVHEWNGASGTLSGNLVAGITPDVNLYADPTLLTDAFQNAAVNSGGFGTARHFFFDRADGLARNLHENLFGKDEKWFRGDTNSLGNSWYFVLPNGDLIEWDGTTSASGHLLAHLGADAWNNVERVVNDFAPTLSTAAQQQLVNIDTLNSLFRASNDRDFFFNLYGKQEKWLEGTLNSFGNPWYFLLPDHTLHSWDGGSATGTTLAQNLSLAAYASPLLLADAFADGGALDSIVKLNPFGTGNAPGDHL